MSARRILSDLSDLSLRLSSSTMMKLTLPSFVLLLAQPIQAQPFSGCSVDQYYSGLSGDPSTWSRGEVHNLIKSTHVGTPQNSGSPRGENDIWQALMDLDEGSNDNMVHLIYQDADVKKVPFGGEFWDKGRVM